ncbi:Anthranilate synthase component 1 [Yarrowia sp. C11]|nr:Anthranilate synthase component 1 [Yarrowia sp. C11]KAG5370423.1 Anthranilate synthase component 1 [Yarrowia sp. E02]
MIQLRPTLEALQTIVADSRATATKDTLPDNLYPVFAYVDAEALTPHTAYLKLARLDDPNRSPSFLFESALGGKHLSRYSFIGSNPRKMIKTGAPHGPDVDPLNLLEAELDEYRQYQTPGVPTLCGGAIGYISYDCIKYFEPRTKRDLKDVLQVPESALMLYDTIVAFDHVYQRLQVITNVKVEADTDLAKAYEDAKKEVQRIADLLTSPEVPQPPQGPVTLGKTFTSNIGQKGYEQHVSTLKERIKKGDIIQAVPSQRVARPTDLHPFNVYRHLRTVNPSPYLFYIDYLDFQLVGASPELLVKIESGRIVSHPIAGTVKRGATPEEDNLLAQELLNSEKDRAEHVMLVDLARNDVNRVCDPRSTSVDRLLGVETFSHVQHLVSQVSGVLRPDQTRFDAFRSIFPAGTVSGAPKVKAMELVGELEKEKRGVYAGAVGSFGYNGQAMDTCIALRTMLLKDGVAYLQAGGGIVFDSDEYDEYVETINKMMANNRCIVEAEEIWAKQQKGE